MDMDSYADVWEWFLKVPIQFIMKNTPPIICGSFSFHSILVKSFHFLLGDELGCTKSIPYNVAIRKFKHYDVINAYKYL